MTAAHRTVTILATLFFTLTLFAATASAEDDGDITDRQRQLNERGVEAIETGDYDRAVDIYESSLELGELNIIHANLGRAHQLAGNCQKADEHFRSALDAPAVDSPPADVVADAVDGYRQELADACPGLLEIDCRPPQMELFIDGDGPQQCHGEPREKMPGNYNLRAEIDDHSVDTSVSIQGLTTTRAELHLDTDVDTELTPPPEVEPHSEDRFSPGILLAGSAATVAGGVALDTLPRQANNYEVNAINFVPIGLYAAGAGLAYFGIRGLFRD